MISKFVTILASLMSIPAHAATKYIDCTQTNDKGVVQIINATVDDASEKAEVRLYATTAKCSQNQSCSTDIYKKEVLPTVIRLSSITAAPKVSYVTVIDIDRTSLSVVTHATLKTPIEQSEDIFTGTCKVRVDDSKKVL